MNKNKFQDIIPPEKRSIRNIPLPKGREVKINTPPPTFIHTKKERRMPPPPPPLPPPGYPEYMADDQKPRSRAGLWLLALIALIILFFGLSYIFAGADVKITPKSQATSIDQVLNADKNASSGNIPYSLITMEKEGSADAEGTGEANVSNKASGQIVIYNAYSSSAQTLVATTRFETPEGLIFRINKDVTVPGQTTVNGQATPGSVEATVFADEAGEKYNVGLKDFTITGFKGTAKYDSFYARSKTSISGGFVGTEKKVADQDLTAAHQKIESDLNQQFLDQANAQKPADYILYSGALITNYIPQPNASSSGDMVQVKEKGTAYAIVLNRDLLNQYLLNALGADSASTTIDGLENLIFTLTDRSAFNQNASSTSFSFRLSGNVNLVSVVDTDALKESLSGISKSKLPSVLADYPAIEKAEVVFKPFWRWSFPDKPQKIQVEIKGNTGA